MVGLLALTVRVRRRWPARALDELRLADNFAVLRDLSRVRLQFRPLGWTSPLESLLPNLASGNRQATDRSPNQ